MATVIAGTALVLALLSPGSWSTYGGDYANLRHTDLSQIDRSNVSQLAPAWRVSLGPHERVESTPVVVGGTLYVTTGVGDNVIAIDAASGKKKWRYRPALGAMSPCCGALNRGVAVENNRVFLATLDARLIALNAATGKPVWNVAAGDARAGFSETMAPLAANGVVYLGSSGSDYGIRGSVSAYRASDGALLWRWYAVSRGWEGRYAPSVHGVSLHRDLEREKRDASRYPNAWREGGGAVWMTPALDPARHAIYVSTGNPNPVFNGAVRPGDNLYTDSIVALDDRTGKMLWYYQQTPHDVWEYEPASPPVLVSVRDGSGRSVPAVVEAGKTRWLYVLNRDTGRPIRIDPFASTAGVYAARGNDPPDAPLPLRGTLGPIAVNPIRHLALITSIVRPRPLEWEDDLSAVDLNDGRVAWSQILGVPHRGIRGDAVLAGCLSTPDLVFAADPDGTFYAFDAAGGRRLWEYRLGSGAEADAGAPPFLRAWHRVHDWLLPLKRRLFHQAPPAGALAGVDGNPIAYLAGGREYVVIGYDDQPESATGGAMLTAFTLGRTVPR